MTNTKLSHVCCTATIFDPASATAYRYADLYAAEVGKPPKPHGTTLGDIYAFDEERSYLISWDNGVVCHYRTRQAPHQIRSTDLECLYRRASYIKPITHGNLPKEGM